jgi:hypothetical protein
MHVIFILSITQLKFVYQACVILSYGETPLMNCGPRSYFLFIAITCLFYSHCLLYSHTIITFHSIRSYPLFQENRWDWQPHRKLGTKYLVVLCVGFTLLLAEDTLTRFVVKRRPYWSVTRISSSTFSRLFAPLQIDIPWFLNWGKTLLLYSSHLPLGVPNGLVINQATTSHAIVKPLSILSKRHQAWHAKA